MLRSSRLAFLSAVLLIAATAPAAMASDNTVRTERPPAKGEALTVDVTVTPAPSMAVVLSLNSFEPVVMRFERTPSVDSVEASTFHVERWSPRTQAALQRSAFDKAFADTLRARDFSPGTFAGAMLDSLVDFAGPDNVIEAVRSYKPRADQYRVLLREIRARTPQNPPNPEPQQVARERLSP